MKRVMMTVAAIAVAGFANAASLTWGGVYGYNGGIEDEASYFTGGQAYLVLVTDAGSFGVSYDGTAGSITGGTIVNSIGVEGGAVSGVWNGAEATLTTAGSYNFAVIFTTQGSAGTALPTAGYWGVSEIASGTFNPASGGSVDFGEAYVSVNTEIGAVPEPTSMALLALGVAALGLRRKFRK